MSVWAELKRSAGDYCWAIVFVLVVSLSFRQSAATVFSTQEPSQSPVIVIDPGHGGSDGGTQSAAGVPESRLNLEISQRLYDLMGLLGMERTMTRQSDVSLDTQGETVRQRKQSDLRNRAALVNNTENGVLLSIHQNFFAESRYSGPQVFSASSPGSEVFAQQMQQALNTALAPDSNRQWKSAQGVYLMEHIEKPGILIECGFLSNPQEAALLQSPQYQKKLACVIAAATAYYVRAGAGS